MGGFAVESNEKIRGGMWLCSFLMWSFWVQSPIYQVSAQGFAHFKYIFALPDLYCNLSTVSLHFATFSYDFVSVSIKTPSLGMNALEDQVTFNKRSVMTYSIPSLFIHQQWPRKLVGVRHSFLLAGNAVFGVTILIVDNRTSSASIHAIPTHLWGRLYFAATWRLYPMMVIASEEGPNQVTFWLRMRPPREEYFLYNFKNYTNNQMFSIVLQRFQAFMLSSCNFSDPQARGGISGTRVESRHPIGITSGNCFTSISKLSCETKDKVESGSDGERVAEMLIPREFMGKEFITLQNDGRLSPGVVMVIAGRNKTTVNYSILASSGPEAITFELQLEGDSRVLPQANHTTKVMGNKVMQVVYFQRSVCESDKKSEMAGPSMCMLVPLTLFYVGYVWNTPATSTSDPSVYYVYIVAKHNDLKHFKYDGQTFRVEFKDVLGAVKWKLGILQTQVGVHEMTGATNSEFGCYIYSWQKSSSFLSGLGFFYSKHREPHTTTRRTTTRRTTTTTTTVPPKATSGPPKDASVPPEQPPSQTMPPDGQTQVSRDVEVERTTKGETMPELTSKQVIASSPPPDVVDETTMKEETPDNADVCGTTKEAMRPGDNIDNDCDGSVDEEQFDHEDNDHDFLYDEDLEEESVTIVHGMWGAWSSWYCDRNCSDRRMIMTRSCNKPSPRGGGQPCIGESKRYKAGTCYDNERCPLSCANGTWGVNCVYFCPHCFADCDKFNGSCSPAKCKSGFKYPLFSCKKSCEPFRFGYGCRQSCKVKCGGHDCVDKSTGDCQDEPNLFPLVFLVIIFPLAILFALRKSHANKQRGEQRSVSKFSDMDDRSLAGYVPTKSGSTVDIDTDHPDFQKLKRKKSIFQSNEPGSKHTSGNRDKDSGSSGSSNKLVF